MPQSLKAPFASERAHHRERLSFPPNRGSWLGLAARQALWEGAHSPVRAQEVQGKGAAASWDLQGMASSTTPGVSPQETVREFTSQESDFGKWRESLAYVYSIYNLNAS